jgi:16S rRNA (guanine527-N7)-methyltransferase
MSLESLLSEGVADLDLDVPSGARVKLLRYLALLQKWNKVINLTAVRNPSQMVVQHLLDSLTVLPHIAGRKSLVDVGSGAGLPGIPLALARPELRVTLLDSNGKKASFLRQAVLELGIEHAAVVCERVESWRPDERFEVVISRALAELQDFARMAGHLCVQGGVIVAMKGLYPYEELARLPPAFTVRTVIPITVPKLAADRHLVMLECA